MINKIKKNPYPLFIIAAAILWAVDGILRRNLYSLSPLVIVFYEHLIGSIILIPLAWKSLKTEKLSRYSLGIIGVIALLSGLLGTLWFTTALAKVNFISFSVVFLIQKLQPIFATTSAAILLKEKVTKRYAVWAGLALVAAFFVTFKNGIINFNTGPATVTAALYAFGAAVAWGTSTSFSKLVLNRHSTIFTTTLRFFVTTIFAFMALIIFGQTDATLAVTSSQLGQFLFIALSTGMVALYLYYKGLQFTEAKVATILELVFPMLAIAIDGIIYKTFLSPAQLIAAAVLLFAMYKTVQVNKAPRA